MRLLLVEDNKVLADWLSRTLRKQLYAVDCVDNGADAVDRSLKDDVDLAVLDMAMPRLTGLQAAEQIRRRRPEIRTLMTRGMLWAARE